MPVRTPILDLVRPIVHAACRAFFRIEFRGVEHIPATGAVIIAPNHQTYADPTIITIPVRRPIHYMAWNRLFEIPGFGWLIRRLRAFPVNLDGRDARATREVVRLLKAGEAVMIFPEGERSLDGRLGPFKPGAFRLAASLGVPVLPVTLVGGHEAWPPQRALPRPGHLTITYHPLVSPQPDADARRTARTLADRTRAAILSAIPDGPSR